jgi:hypothetical protein
MALLKDRLPNKNNLSFKNNKYNAIYMATYHPHIFLTIFNKNEFIETKFHIFAVYLINSHFFILSLA